MENLMRKYARVLLESCLKVEENQPLFVSFNVERLDFVRIVSEEAYKLGIKDIFFDMSDPYLKHSALKYLEVEELKKDRTKTQVEGFTKLDLMEMTRKHICSHKE